MKHQIELVHFLSWGFERDLASYVGGSQNIRMCIYNHISDTGSISSKYKIYVNGNCVFTGDNLCDAIEFYNQQ